MEESVKVVLLSRNVFTAVIPGGCTSQIQTFDVCINQSFKVEIKDSDSNTQWCDTIVSAWNYIEP